MGKKRKKAHATASGAKPTGNDDDDLDDVTFEDLRGDAMKMSMMKASVESNKQKYACDMPSECVNRTDLKHKTTQVAARFCWNDLDNVTYFHGKSLKSEILAICANNNPWKMVDAKTPADKKKGEKVLLPTTATWVKACNEINELLSSIIVKRQGKPDQFLRSAFCQI